MMELFNTIVVVLTILGHGGCGPRPEVNSIDWIGKMEQCRVVGVRVGWAPCLCFLPWFLIIHNPWGKLKLETVEGLLRLYRQGYMAKLGSWRGDYDHSVTGGSAERGRWPRGWLFRRKGSSLNFFLDT
jgi:hypothetical protein